jgi:hypothetical protein
MSFILFPSAGSLPTFTGANSGVAVVPIAITNGDGTAGNVTGGDITVQCGNGFGAGIGGTIFIASGANANGNLGGVVNALGAQSTLGGIASISGGDAVNAGSNGGSVGIQGGQSLVGDLPGDTIIAVASDGVAATGLLRFEGVLGVAAADAPNGQVVNIAGTGPGGGAVTITKWLRCQIDGVGGWIPFAT